LSGLFMTETASTVITSFLCLLIGVALLVPLHQDRSGEIRIKDLAETLKSSRWQDRAIALKIAEQQRIEVADFSGCQELFKSPHVPERYWLARALGFSRKPETFKDLLTLLDDPHPNVICMAFYALGQRGDRRAVTEIINRIERSDHWYEQWYAYKALRSMGWKQKSN
jgi:HEAT repeat protein